MDAALLSRLNGAWLIAHYGLASSSMNQQFKRFYEIAQRGLNGMQHASQMQDLVGWKFHANAIKKAASAITARRIVGLCEEAESMLSLSPTDGLALLYHFEKELAILRRESAYLLAA